MKRVIGMDIHRTFAEMVFWEAGQLHPAGRVDMTDELRRYVLYRFVEEGRDVWLIDDLESEPRPLDQAAFERALMSYLR